MRMILHRMLIMEVIRMPNTKAKDRKRKKRMLNKKWATEGRTAVQHKKWLEKNKDNPMKNIFGK